MEVCFLFWLLFQVSEARNSDIDYRTVYACEGGQLHASCEDGYRIHLLRANYGRYSISICNDHGSLDWSVDCASHLSYFVIQERCNRMSSCIVSATSEIFADPCPGTYKYLEVQYQCKLESFTTTRLSTSTSPTSSTYTTRPPIIIPLTKFTAQTTQPRLPSHSIKPSTTLFSQVVIHLPTEKSLKSTTQSALFNKADHCPPVQSRNLSWDWTKAGSEAVQKCPGGTSGEVRWKCGSNPIRWIPDSPNLSDCRSLWIDNLKNRVDSGDSVVNIAAELSVMTNRKTLYAGDIRQATQILHRLVAKMEDKMKDIADDMHQLLQELLESVSDITSNLLDAKSSWEEVSLKEKKDIASILLETIEHSSWLLAGAHESPFRYQRSLRNLFLSVKVMEVWTVSQITFPSNEDIGYSALPLEDSISLPVQALLGALTKDVLKVVFVSYNNVKDFLGTVSSNSHRILCNSSLVINSNIISASTGGYSTKFPEPVTITFKLLKEENVTNPKCVFWNTNTRLWSEEGCQLKEDNKTHAVCECDHLTNFALLMEYSALQDADRGNDSPKNIILISCIIAMVLFILTALIPRFLGTSFKDSGSIQTHLCVVLALAECIFVGSTNQTGISCTILAGILHFLLEVVFLWFSFYALHLYLFETSQNRLISYYSIMVYGTSILIVTTSFCTNPSNYGTTHYCFLQLDGHFTYSFLFPTVASIIVAVIFLGLSFSKIHCSSNTVSEETIQIIKYYNNSTWVVLISCASSWISLLLYMKYKVLAYLFPILNFLQGVAFLMFFVISNNEVQQCYREWKSRDERKLSQTQTILQTSAPSSHHREAATSTSSNITGPHTITETSWCRNC